MNLSGRERYIAIGAAVVIGALALDSILIEPLFERLNAATAKVGTGEKQMRDATNLFSTRKHAKDKWAEIAGASLKTEASAAEGQLLNSVRDFAQGAGLVLISLRPERSEKENDFQRITVRAAANGTMAEMSRFLYALKNADIPLRVSDMQFSSRKEGTDDIALQIGVSTIYVLPPEPANATGTGVRQ